MIKIIKEVLAANDWVGCGECIEIAKGKYELPITFRGLISKYKRQWQLKQK